MDVVFSGVALANKLNITSQDIQDKKIINTMKDLYQTFVHFFSRGAAAER